MSKGRTSKARLGLLAALVLGLFAFVVAPAPALAEEAGGSGSSDQSTFNVGGLIFTTTNPSGTTKTSVTLTNTGANGYYVTITGGDADFTVTQDVMASGNIAEGIQIGGGSGSEDTNYTGTMTLNNVKLDGILNGSATAFNAPIVNFNNASTAAGKDGATLILGNGTVIGNANGTAANTASKVLVMSSNATDDTLVLQSGSQVVGNKSSAITLGISIGDCTIEFAGGSVSSINEATAAAITVGASTAGSLTMDVTGDSTVTGSASAAGTAATSNALSVATSNNNAVTITGSGSLTLIGGNGVTSSSTGSNGASAVNIVQGSLVVDGSGTLTIQGGRGGDSPMNGSGTDGVNVSSVKGGAGINIALPTGGSAGSAKTSSVVINDGTVVVAGGVGASANSKATTATSGGPGGDAIALGVGADNNAVDLTINGGSVQATGGNGGNPTAGSNGTKGTGGSGITGTGSNYTTMTVQYGDDAVVMPTVIAVAGSGSGAPVASSMVPTVYYYAAGPDGNPAGNTDDDADLFPWVAYSTTTGKEPAASPSSAMGTLVSFAGLADNTPDFGTATWACIKAAPLESLSVGVNNPYVLAQTEASMVNTLPDTNAVYTPVIEGTFEGLENVNTGNLVNNLFPANGLVTGGTDANVAFDPAENVAPYNSNKDFYVVKNAEGNTLTVSLTDDILKNPQEPLKTVLSLYPDVKTVEPGTVNVVYTVNVSANATANGGSVASPGNVFTSSDGKGNLVKTAGDATPVITSIAGTGSDAALTVTPDGTTNEFIGLFDETATPYEQVSVTDVTGWNSNANLTAEFGKVTLNTVTPSPTTLPQGESVQLTASYSVTPTNKAITSLSLPAAGLTADWQAQFVNLGTGNAGSNGVTVEQTGGNTATGTAPFTMTSVATVTANATADLGHYRVWPNWVNTYNPNATGNTQPGGVYGIVEVVPGSGQPSATSINVMRVYNPNSGEHLYSTDQNEVDTLVNAGWDYENVAWVAPTESATPIYRLYNPYNGDHLYTTSLNEYDTLDNMDWEGEGIKMYSAPTTGAPIYRLYNPNMTANGGAYAHLWTGDYNEYVTLWQRDGWTNESVAFWALSVPNPS